MAGFSRSCCSFSWFSFLFIAASAAFSFSCRFFLGLLLRDMAEVDDEHQEAGDDARSAGAEDALGGAGHLAARRVVEVANLDDGFFKQGRDLDRAGAVADFDLLGDVQRDHGDVGLGAVGRWNLEAAAAAGRRSNRRWVRRGAER